MRRWHWIVWPAVGVLVAAASAIVWMALASLALIYKKHWFPYVHWPDAITLWWTYRNHPALGDVISSSAWLATEITAGAALFGFIQCWRLIAAFRSQSPGLYGNSKWATERNMADSGIVTSRRPL